MKTETRGAKPNPRSKRARLAAMRPGDTEFFVVEGVSYHSASRAITSEIAKHFQPIRLEFSTQRALLVFDESRLPLAVCVVTRRGDV